MLPSDRTLLVERFRDELGDWRLVVHSPYGTPVHAPVGAGHQRPAARALRRRRPGGRLRRRHRDPDPRHRRRAAQRRGDRLRARRDRGPRHPGGRRLGAVRRPVPRVRRPRPAAPPPRPRPPLARCGSSASAAPQLLEVAVEVPVVPDRARGGARVPPGRLRPARAGRADAAASSGARCRSSTSPTQPPSPFARSLLFGYVAQFVYEGDSPIAERRAAALSLDQGLLAELLGRAELRELLDPEVLAEVEAELQRLAPDRRARDAEGVADLLRLLGPLTTDGGRPRARVDGADVAELARPRSPTPAASSRSGWPARSAGPPSRTSAGCATASACRCRPAPPTRSPSRSTTRSATWSPATPAPTARSPPPTSPPGSASARAVVRHTLQRLAAPGPGARRRVPARRLRHRVVRRRGAAPAAPPLAGPAAQGGRAGRARSAGPLPAGLAARQPARRPRRPARRRRRAHRDRPAGRLRRSRPRALEPLVLAARVRDYEPSLPRRAHRLRRGALGRPRRAARHRRLGLACTSPTRPRSRCPSREPFEHTRAAPGGARRARPGRRVVLPPARRRRSGPPTTARSRAALWELVWAGRISNDTLTPLRALTRGGTPATAAGARRRGRGWPRPTRPRPDARRAPARPRPPGRWALLPELDTDPTRRAHATAERLLDRHGVVTRGAVVSERVPGGFAAVYKVLSAFEDSGRCRRGYFVEGLGAAQFGTAGAIDRLRTFTELARPDAKPSAVALAATDPANPYGAALPWPERDRRRGARGHRPGPQGRRAGRARRRRAHALRRARRPHPAHLVRRPRPARPGRRSRWPRPRAAGRWAG